MNGRWQICTERVSRLEKARRVYVSLNRRGEIVMNAEAFERIKKPATVTLLFDAEWRRIGVKFPVAADRNFFPVRRYGRGRKMRIVRAARLLKQFGIEVERTIVCTDAEAVMFQGVPMLVLEVGEGEEKREPPRPRNAATPPL